MLALAEQVLARARENDLEESNPYWYWMEQLIANGTSVPLHFGEAEELFNLMIKDRSHPANEGDGYMGSYRYSLLLAKSGLFDPAIELMASLQTTDPMSVDIKLRLAEFYAAIYDYESALSTYQQLLDISLRFSS